MMYLAQTCSKSRVDVQVLRISSFQMIYVLGSEDDFSDFLFVIIVEHVRSIFLNGFLLSCWTPTWVWFLHMIYNQLKHSWRATQQECLTVIGCVCGWFITAKLFNTVLNEVTLCSEAVMLLFSERLAFACICV
jgi:hypothetical protein